MILNSILNLIYPQKCFFCGKTSKSHGICIKCLNDFEQVDISTYINEGHLKQVFFDKITCGFAYSNKLKQAICNYKFNKLEYYYTTFAYILASEFRKDQTENLDMLLYVPNFSTNPRHNHMLIIAQKLSKMIRVPLYNNVLIKIKQTNPQHYLNYKDRFENIKDCFIAAENAANKNILLIDDVFTTGNTLNECSRVLKNKGARFVHVLVLSKTNLYIKGGREDKYEY